ncbi:MAG TPA: serine/threonine-protein kinase [Chitinophagales bacterium]|nr:serine/threonine-protein kinase [Chitinophagales bacterium]
MLMTLTKTYEFNPDTDLLGTGGFGKVYKALDKNLGMTVAIKKYSGNLPAKYSLFEEIKRAIGLNHPNLVRYYDAFELQESSTFGDTIQVGVLEFINGGDLGRLLKQKPDLQTLTGVLIGIMQGLRYLHSMGIIHRDMKPENILLHKDTNGITPKITDFGISKVITDSSSTGGSSLVIGSIEYMAPEQFNMQKFGNNGQLHTNLDLWSLGAIIYECFTGAAPFGKTQQGFSRDEIMRNIFDKEPPDMDKVPQPFRRVVERCLVRNASQRAQTVDELMEILYENPDARVVAAHTMLGSGTAVLHANAGAGKLTHQIADYFKDHAGKPAATTPKPTTKSSGTSVSADPDGFNPKTWLPVGIPILTALLGYLFADNNYSVFGGVNVVSNTYKIYPAVFCVCMAAVNIAALIIRQFKAFEIPVYALSFMALIYYIGKSWLTWMFDVPGYKFNFFASDFAKFYPLATAGVMVVAFLLAAVLWKRR